MFSHKLRKTTQMNQTNNNFTSPVQMPFMFKFATLSAPPQPKSVPIQQSQQSVTNILPKMKWGRHIWTFFHTMSQKVKPEYFDIVKKDFIDFIIKICNTLPCPICSQHASEYMRSINFNNIRTKEDLIQLFYVFHNTVNARKNYEFFKSDQLSMYQTANTIAVINNFMVAFEDKTRAFKLMADDMSRAQIAGQIKFWLSTNLRYFDP